MAKQQAFEPLTPTYAVVSSATSTTAFQVNATSPAAIVCNTYTIVNDCNQTVAVRFAATATAAVFPVSGTPQPDTFVLRSGETRTVSSLPNAFVTTISIAATPTGSIYVTGGEGGAH